MTPAARLMIAHLRGKDLASIRTELESAEGSVKDEYERNALTEAIGGLIIASAALIRVERLAHARQLADEQLNANLVASIRLVKGRKECEQVGGTK